LSKFYLTTPIYYVNDAPHIGHIYTTVVADVVARFRRLAGDDVRFLTGTDEHGQKIERAAREQGITPIELADRVVARYAELWPRLGISHDDFIRTTEARHKKGVLALIERLREKGDLFLARHGGWYCSGCEEFKTEKELLPGNVCPDHARPAAWQEEENWFFRLSAYGDRLLEHYERNPDFIRPESRRNEVVAFVRGGLRDLSVSRTNISWGIPFPGSDGHVVYVWLDALTNYMTALGFGESSAADPRSPYSRYWPADLHIVGKDILRFHAVYWPAFLFSAGLPLPKCVYAHGWWLRDEKKMSKTIGNVVRPDHLIDDFGPDALRYFLLREMTFGQDASFSDEAFAGRYNADLANDLGNTVSRVTKMAADYFDGKTPPELDGDSPLRTSFEATLPLWKKAMTDYRFQDALNAIWRFLTDINQFVVQNEPWKIHKEDGSTARLSKCLWSSLESIRLVSILIEPVMPGTAASIRRQVGLPASPPLESDLVWGRLPVSQPLSAAGALFPRIDTKEYLKPAPGVPAESANKKETPMSQNETPGPGAPPPAATVPPPAETPKPKAEPEAAAEISIDDFFRTDLRVGEVVAAEAVPKSNKLLKLSVRIGENTRTVVAGIAKRYTPEQMVGRKIVVVANLKPAKLMGIESHGMVLAASQDGEPIVLTVDPAVPTGTKVR